MGCVSCKAEHPEISIKKNLLPLSDLNNEQESVSSAQLLDNETGGEGGVLQPPLSLIPGNPTSTSAPSGGPGGAPGGSPPSLPIGGATGAASGVAPGGPSYRQRSSRVHYGQADLIYERYNLTNEVLGTGVSGIVRIGVDRESGLKYAVKTLNLTNINKKKSAMLHNEVEIYLQLDHPNIAKLIEVFEDEKKIHVVMELCDGGELYDRLSARKRFTEQETIHLTKQMLQAIRYCHEHHVVHRDLKLENWVFANSAGAAAGGSAASPLLKLIDFGFSRIFSPVVPMTAMHGTVYYVSPEVMDGCYREKCDIWSIGVIVYMLLSGTPPFNGTADYQILTKIKNCDYHFNHHIWKSISTNAKLFIQHLLIKDPQIRPSANDALNHPWLTTDNKQEL